MNSADRWISSQRTHARANTSPLCQVDTGICASREIPAGKSKRTSRSSPAGPRGDADQSQRLRDLPRHRAGLFEPGQHRRRLPQQIDRAGHVLERPVEPVAELGDPPPLPDRTPRRRAGPGRGRTGCRRAARSGSGSRRAAARRTRRWADTPRRPPAPRGRRCDWPDAPAPGRCPAAPRRVRGRGTRSAPPPPGSRPWRGRSSCRRPGSPCSGSLRGVGPPDHGPLDAAVLVAQRDLQVEDVLAVALEAEMARLDHPGMDRPHRDLVDLRALDPEEVGHARQDRIRGRSAPGVPAGPVRSVEPDGLEPGMAVGRTPHCSAISRSNQWACGQSDVSAG